MRPLLNIRISFARVSQNAGEENFGFTAWVISRLRSSCQRCPENGEIRMCGRICGIGWKLSVWVLSEKILFLIWAQAAFFG